MAWIRLSDDYNDHPKFAHLSDGAFRLWHQAIGYCRKYKTDGLLPTRTLREFKAYSPKRMRELLTPWQEGEHPLWLERGEGWGVVVHDYLQWNPSKDEENERRAGSKEQMRLLREERRRVVGVAPVSTNSVLTHRQHAPAVNRMLREGMGGKEDQERSAEKELGARAGRFLQVTYPSLYSKYRNGAKLTLVGNSLEYEMAVTLVRQWDDARLEKLAALVLTTDDEWIARTDRGFKILSLKASWADDRLAAWEKSQEAAS